LPGAEEMVMSMPDATPERVFVKLGGSLITDKDRRTPEVGGAARLCAEIHAARAIRPLELLLAHGGGSFPHVSASRYRTADGRVDGAPGRVFAGCTWMRPS